ncbi:hypothetical protein SMMN14_02012 [Sphaerulina musiva]
MAAQHQHHHQQQQQLTLQATQTTQTNTNPTQTQADPSSSSTLLLYPLYPPSQQTITQAFQDQEVFIQNLEQEALIHERLIQHLYETLATQENQRIALEEKCQRLQDLVDKFREHRNVPSTAVRDLMGILEGSNEA